MENYSNPLKKQGDFADPFILRYNGKYYLYCTNPDLRCWSSVDLINWELEGATISKNEFPGLVPFAPEVVYFNGYFYLYTSPSGKGHYCLRSTSPKGPFKKISKNLGHNIDGSVFIDDDGKQYFYWASDEGILGCEMLSPTKLGKPINTKAYLNGWTEGPFVIKSNNKYYMTYTGNHYLSKGYRINLAIASKPLGPYHDIETNPFIINSEGAVIGLGHSSTVLGPDLYTYYLAYHNINSDKSRDLNIDPLVISDSMEVLGPNTNSQSVPQLADYVSNGVNDWEITLGSLLSDNEFMINDGSEFQAKYKYMVETPGTIDLNICSEGNKSVYGIILNNHKQKVEIRFSAKNNTIALLINDRLTVKNLPDNYRHNVLHELMIRIESQRIEVHLDYLLIAKLRVNLTDSELSIFEQSGILKIGYLGITKKPDSLPARIIPLQTKVEDDNKQIKINIIRENKYLLTAVGTNELKIKINDQKLRTVKNNDFCISTNIDLLKGNNVLLLKSKEPYNLYINNIGSKKNENIIISNVQGYEKILSKNNYDDFVLKIDLCDHISENWGILFRVSNPSDGGEGNDKIIGTNFFIGYSLNLRKGKLQLCKNQYNETKLISISNENVGKNITIKCVENAIIVISKNKVLMDYRDYSPLLCGKIGIRNQNGHIDKIKLKIETEKNHENAKSRISKA